MESVEAIIVAICGAIGSWSGPAEARVGRAVAVHCARRIDVAAGILEFASWMDCCTEAAAAVGQFDADGAGGCQDERQEKKL